MLLVAFLCKLAASAATVAVFVLHYGVNDNVTYHRVGMEHAIEIWREPGLIWSELARALWYPAATSSTERMFAISAVLLTPLGGSFLGGSAVCGAIGFAGQYLFYRVFTANYPHMHLRVWWQIGLLLLPSLVFWSAGLFKETFGLLGLGAVVWGLDRLSRRNVFAGTPILFAGAYVLLLFRPQVLIALLPAIGSWGFVLAMQQITRLPLRVGLALVTVLVVPLSVLALGVLEPRYSLAGLRESIAFEISQAQSAPRASAGSNLSAPLIEEVNPRSLVLAWPRAIMTALYRPFPWEAPGILGAIASVENTVLALITARALWVFARHARLWPTLLLDRWFVSNSILVAMMALVVAISQINLGTISRYRAPLLPFLVASVLIVEAHRLRVTRHVSTGSVASSKTRERPYSWALEDRDRQ